MTADTKRYLEQLQGIPDKKNEYRQAGLLKLSEIYEQTNMPAAKLRALYEDIQASSTDAEVARQAGVRLKELK
jgi:hypothetical protein